MSDVIATMTGPQLIGLVAVAGGLLFVTAASLAAIVAPFLTSCRKVEALCQLKRELAAAGYSAADIERIVQAAPSDPAPRR